MRRARSSRVVNRAFSLKKLALDGAGDGVAGQTRHGQRKDPVSRRAEGVEANDI
jgi:hypothetical protein